MKLLAVFGLGRVAPLEAEISKLRQALQDVTTERLIAEDRLHSALNDKEQLWGLMGKSIDDMKIAYQMHINLSWQKQGLPAPYPESPGIPQEKMTAFEKPEHTTIPRPKIPSEIVEEHKRRLRDKILKGSVELQ